MNRKVLSKISLTLSLVALVGAQSAFGIDKDTQERIRLDAVNISRYAIPADGQQHAHGLGAADRTVGQYMGTSSSSSVLGCNPGVPDAVRGLTVGCTFYDYQRNGSMNRIIGNNEPEHNLNFTWMNQDNNSATGGRNVKYDGLKATTGVLAQGSGGDNIGGNLIPPNRSGYTSLDTRGAGGLAVNAHHWNTQFDTNPGAFDTWTFFNQSSTLADFQPVQADTAVVNGFKFGDAEAILWPRVAYTRDGATEVTHVVIHSDRGDVDAEAFYIRKVGSGTAGTWDAPILVGIGGYQLSSSITASRKAGSQKVVIAGSYGRGDGTALGIPLGHQNGLGTGQQDNDIYYMESLDAGATWGPITNVTQRPDSLPHPGAPIDQFAPGAKLDVLYEPVTDVFHIVWQSADWLGYGFNGVNRGRLFHYDPVNDVIRIVHDFMWNQTLCSGGAFNLNATNPQISACAGKLYVTFEQFNDQPNGILDDCSESAVTAPGGAANGDIYVVVSVNDGQNWDVKRNLTATYTPDCDTLPGGLKSDCDSDVWHSTTRYGVNTFNDDFGLIADLTPNIDVTYIGDDFLFVMYVNDSDPGGAIQSEGVWTNNSLKVFQFGCVDIVQNEVIVSSIATGQSVADPAFTPPNEDSVLVWVLTNVGNVASDYAIAITNQDPAGNVTVTGNPLSGVISENLPNFLAFDLTLNAGLESALQHAHADITVTGDFVGSPLNLAIDYTIGLVKLREIDTIASCLIFANTGGIALQNAPGIDGLTMDFQNRPASLECDTTGNADNYLFDGSPIVSYPGVGGNIVVSSMFSQSIVDTFQFRPLGSPSIDNSDPDWFFGNSGQFTTQDSTLCFNIDWWGPKTTIFNEPNWKVVFGRVCYYNNTTTAIDSVFCAYGWDWDVPSDSGSDNTSAIQSANNLILMQGAEFSADTGNTACLPNDQRWAATMFVPTTVNALDTFSTTGSGVMGVGFQSLYTRDNATYVGTDWDFPKLDTALHNISGFSKFSSTALDSAEVDLHMVLNGGQYRIDPDDSLYLWFIMITGIGTQTAFDDCVASVKGIAPPVTPAWILGCCNNAGDYNNDGGFNIGDVTAGIARIFTPGSPAPSCTDQADFNSDGGFNIGDVTAGIARIFTPGSPAPVCGNSGA